MTSNFSFAHNVSTQSDNCIPICPIFDITSLFAAELEEPKIAISGKVLSKYTFNAVPCRNENF